MSILGGRGGGGGLAVWLEKVWEGCGRVSGLRKELLTLGDVETFQGKSEGINLSLQSLKT